LRGSGYGGLAMRFVSDSYIALFSHFVPCGAWEAVYIIDGLLRNDSDVQPETIHADTQGQSLPVFGLAALLGFELLPRIRNWPDLNFYRPDAATRYQHIDSLFSDNRSNATGPTCCARQSRFGKAGSPRWRCCAGWATTRTRTACTGRSGSWAG
jgi:TnpA family transposase